MARSQAVDYNDKRQMIALKAAELFAKQGAGSASLLKIAKECGMSKSLIYHYYSSKEELLYDVMRTHMDELIATIDEIEAQNLSGSDAFHAFSKTLMELYAGAADSQKVLLYELNNLPEENRHEIIVLQRKLIGYAQELLTRALTGSVADGAELRSRVMLFFGMLNWTHSWFNPSGPINRDRVAFMAADATLKGCNN